jgi:hypothetical protein
MGNRAAMTLVAAMSLAGCASIGPSSVVADRFDYSTAIADSWKEQTLLNIVKLRYMDLPVFVEVSSVVAGYSLQTGVTIGGVTSSRGAVQGDYGSIGGQAIYTDRPTITYAPMTGEKFLRGLITPIDPKNIFFMLQSGYAADFVLGLTVESLNGVRNSSTARGTIRPADPDFVRALHLLRDMQAAGAMGMRVEEDKAKGTTGVVFFRRDDVSPEIVAMGAEVRRLLKLSPDPQKFVITYSPMPGTPNELAVNSRSMLQIMSALASYIVVPSAHIEDRSTIPSFADAADAGGGGTPVRIHSGKDRPDEAFAAVRYRDYWYWVNQDDLLTKRALTAVMFFFTLADTGSTDNLPLITIPAQ